ncbi:MAG: class I SAM-dependent methyltransferase [Vicinamibacterales bacterium]
MIAAVCLLWSVTLPAVAQRSAPTVAPLHPPDVIFLPSADEVVQAMLKLAKVTRRDVVYDLGCGDGKIVIAAARQFGARGVGIDIDPARVDEARANARTAGVADQVTFFLGDIFDETIPIRDATVVTLYLLPSLNQKLRPRLWSELAPGTRVVSNSFDMGRDWPADRTEHVGNFTIYLWTVPKRAALP